MNLSPLIISLKTAGLSTLFSFFLGILIAWGVVSMPRRWQGLVDGILTLPLVLPPTVTGFILLLIFGKNGPIGKFLLSIGIKVVFTVTGAVIAAFVVAFPLMYRTVKDAFEQIDPDLIYAGRTLGMSEMSIFRRVMIPAALPGIGAGLVLSFARALGEFGATLMLAGNLPGRTQTVSLMIYTATAAGDYELASKWVVVIVAISLSSIGLMNWWIDRSRRHGR